MCFVFLFITELHRNCNSKSWEIGNSKFDSYPPIFVSNLHVSHFFILTFQPTQLKHTQLKALNDFNYYMIKIIQVFVNNVHWLDPNNKGFSLHWRFTLHNYYILSVTLNDLPTCKTCYQPPFCPINSGSLSFGIYIYMRVMIWRWVSLEHLQKHSFNLIF